MKRLVLLLFLFAAPAFAGQLPAIPPSAPGVTQSGTVTVGATACWTANGIIGATGCSGGSSVTWPSSGNLILSTGTNTPSGLAEIDGDCVIGAGGVWTAGSCGGGLAIGTTTISGATSGALLYANGTTLGQLTFLPQSKGGTGTTSTFTQGSVLFAEASGVYSQDNSKFFWNDSSGFLGIGAAGSPTVPLQVGAAPITGPSANTLASFSGAASTSYTQVNVQNTAAAGQSGYTATAADGSDTTHYVFLGMNNGTGPASSNAFFTNAHAASLYNIDSELDIGALGTSGQVNVYAGQSTTPNAYVKNGLVVGAPTGADEGTGTVNSTGYYVNGSANLPSATTSQLYGGTGVAGVAGPITLGTGLSMAGTTLNATGGGGGALTLISTQTASASASLAWTGLPTTYNQLMLTCQSLVPSTATGLLLQVGTGAGPTYQTSGYYAVNNECLSGNGACTVTPQTAATSYVLTGASGFTATTSFGNVLTAYIGNINLTASYKTLHTEMTYFYQNNGTASSTSGGSWNGTAAVTALKLALSSGTITSGTCSLYGLSN